MGITCEVEGRRGVLAIAGEVDHHGARTMMQQIDVHIDQTLPQEVILDLSGVTFMDSSGIAVVLRCHRRCQELGSKMTVVGTPTQAKKVLLAAGLDKMMTVL